MKLRRISLWVLSAAVLLATGAISPSRSERNAAEKPGEPLIVGWNDEFNATTNWQTLPLPNKPDVTMANSGLLRLTLGSDAITNARPAFYWASMTRIAEVNMERYPILAVRAVHLKKASWWDVEIQAYEPDDGKQSENDAKVPGHALVGSEVKTPSLDHDGIILFDLQSQANNGLKITARKFRLRISIASQSKGGSVEYDWLRFVRREDAERLRKNPRISGLVVEP